MKKVSLLLMGIVFAFAANAQTVLEHLNAESTTVNTVSPKNTSPVSYPVTQHGTLAAAGDTIAYYDFNTSVGWTVGGSTAKGWSIGTTNTWWSTQGISSTSGANWACMNPGPTAGAVASEFNLTTTAINCTGKNSVILSFEQFYARFEDSTWVQISTDNVNYTTVFDNFDWPMTVAGSSNPTPNPQKITVNISKLVANKPNVYVRFRWKSRTLSQPGIGYGWWIDDVKLLEGENNDITMENMYWKPYTDSTYSHYPDFYTRMPNRQARAYPLRFGARFSNVGGVSQINAGYNAIVDGPGAFYETASATKSIVGALDTDSASTTKDITLTGGTGNYNISLVATSDSTLSLTQDDTVGGTIMVTEDVYARDDNDTAAAGAFQFTQAVYSWELGVLYELKTLDTIKAIEWVNPSANKTTPNNGTVTVHVYNAGGYSSTGVSAPAQAPIFSSQPISLKDIAGKPNDNTWIRTPVTRVAGGTGDTLSPGNYVVSIQGNQNFGADNIFWPVQRTDFTSTQYFLRVDASSGALGQWSLGNRKYMVRMVTAPTACPNLIGSVASGTPTTACGNTDGEVEVTTDPTTGSAPFTYLWDINGVPTSGKKVVGLGSGSYEVTITDANGCKVTNSAGVSDFGAPTVTHDVANSVTTTTCFGQQQGEIAITVVKGANPNPVYSYSWVETSAPGTTISTNAKLTNAEAGTYRVAVNDGSTPPCIQSITVVINGPKSGINVGVSKTDNDCKGYLKGELELVLSGGTGNLTVAWAGGSSTTKRVNLAAGNYAYTVTDGNGCTKSGSENVTEPTVAFKIGEAKYSPGAGESSITPINGKPTVELNVVTTGGSIGTSGSVKWKNPAGAIITGETKALLTIGTNEGPEQDGYGKYIAEATSSIGCVSDPVIFNVLQEDGLFPFSVNEFGSNSTLSIFPNPSKGMVNVKLDNSTSGEYTISIKNVVGQTVYTETLTSNGNLDRSINLENSDAGVYFINISNETVEVSQKIIIE